MVEGYPLLDDDAESQRLNTQHRALIAGTGYLLHPRIAAALETRDAPHIADVATGTGIWLLDLEADTAPRSASWSFTGLDMSDAKFPPASSLSGRSRCRFDVWNIQQPVPSHLRGAFDVVHIRALVGALTTSAWAAAAKNVFELLKPGGWLQWHEADACSVRVHPTDADSPDSASGHASEALLATFTNTYQSKGRFLPVEMTHFQNGVAAAGFQDLEIERQMTDRVPEARKPASLSFCRGIAVALQFAVRNAANSELTVEDVDRMASAALADVEGGKCYWSAEMYMVTAQRP